MGLGQLEHGGIRSGARCLLRGVDDYARYLPSGETARAQRDNWLRRSRKTRRRADALRTRTTGRTVGESTLRTDNRPGPEQGREVVDGRKRRWTPQRARVERVESAAARHARAAGAAGDQIAAVPRRG